MSIQRQNRPTHNLSAKIDKSQAHPVSATETLPSPHIRINEQIINYDISMNGITKMDVRPVDPTALFLIDSDYEVLTRRKPRILGENGTRAYLKATPCGNKKTNEYDAEKTLQAGKEVLDLVINSITTSNYFL